MAGRNAQGKSSVLDAIWAALAGKDGQVARPIRDGARKASVTLDLGDLTVTRKWSGARTELVVTSKGARYNSPQTVLDGLIGRLSFDPLSFATMEPAKQRNTLIDLAGADLHESLERVAEQRSQAYADRTDNNRDAKRLRAQIEGLPEVPPTTPDDEIDYAQLVGELQAAEQAKNRKDALLAEHARNKLNIEHLVARQAEIVAEGGEIGTLPDIAALAQRAISADEINKAVRAKHHEHALAADLKIVEDAAAAQTATINACDNRRETLLGKATFPIDGLSFDDEGVLYNGVPFAQASAAERLRVSVAMAMAMNPEVRVIRITDGSLLDSENLALIESMAAEKDFQVWLETVDSSGTVGIQIEDGEVVETKPVQGS